MYRKSLLSSGLYRIYVTIPAYVRQLVVSTASKRHTPCALRKDRSKASGHTLGVRPQTGIRWMRVLAEAGALWGILFSGAALADVADTLLKIKPGVVGVGTFSPSGRPRASLQGTGFAVLDGHYVVSCAHIFSKPLDSEKKETHAVFLSQDRQMVVRMAELIATDKAHDLALLKIAGDPLPALKLGDSSSAREGWQLYFTGYPIGSVLGLNPSTHRAGLAAILPIITPMQNAAQLTARTLKQAQNGYDVFELDAIAYPGNSGSPVWHPDTGEVLGVVNSVYVKGAKEAALSAPSGISYAIPVKYVHELLNRALQEAK